MNDRYDQIDFSLPPAERLGFALGTEVREAITAHLGDVHPVVGRVTDELMTWVRGAVGHIRNEAAVALVNHAVNDFQDLADALMQGEGRNAARVTRSLFEHLVNLCEVSATPDSARRYVAHKAVSAQILSRMTRGLAYLKGTARKAEAHRLRKLRNASASDYAAAMSKYGSGFRRNWATDNLRDRANRFGYGADYDTYSLLSQVAHGSHGGLLGTYRDRGDVVVHRTGISLDLAVLAYLEGTSFFRSFVTEASARHDRDGTALDAALADMLATWPTYRAAMQRIDALIWPTTPPVGPMAVMGIFPNGRVRWYHHEPVYGKIALAQPPDNAQDLELKYKARLGFVPDGSYIGDREGRPITVAVLGVHVTPVPGARWRPAAGIFQPAGAEPPAWMSRTEFDF